MCCVLCWIDCGVDECWLVCDCVILCDVNLFVGLVGECIVGILVCCEKVGCWEIVWELFVWKWGGLWCVVGCDLDVVCYVWWFDFFWGE